MRIDIRYRNTRAGFILVMLWFFIAPDIIAQNGGFAGASSRIGYSARGMAMSNAMSAVTSEGAYSYYNPAQSALFIEYKQTDLTVGALKFDRVFQSTGIQFQLPPSAGLSFNILRTGVSDIDARTSSGYPIDKFDASEYQLSGNFGIRISEKLNAGVGLVFNIANYHPMLDNPTSFGIDLGLLYQTNLNINLSLAVKDLFSSYSWNSQDLYNLSQAQDVINQFPSRIITGAAYQVDDFTISGEIELQVYNSETQVNELFVLGGSPVYSRSTEEVRTSSSRIRLGGSWQAHERFTFRGGWQLPETTQIESWAMSSGFSIHLPFDVFSPSIDYAFVMEPYRISNMHVFSLRLNL
ncbi:MAG: hypothetical protein WD357_03405 [Gracilimonas sp.]